MITIAIANGKGGVGKTMTALMLGHALQRRDFSVLWVDADPQGSLTKSFRYAPPPSLTLGPVLLGQMQPADVVYEVPECPAGWLLPAGPALREASERRAALPGADLALRKILAVVGGLDFCIIDTPGNLGPLTTAALTAADFVFIPSPPQAYGIQEMVDLVSNCRMVQEGLNPGLKIGGLVFTMYSRADNQMVLKQLAALIEGHGVLGPYVMRNTIRRNTHLEQAVTEKVSIFDHAPESNGARDYDHFAGEVLALIDHA